MCTHCGAELIAKCGTVKIHHWAHKGIRNCDPWWENETEWHRFWKSHYTAAWQEFSMLDPATNEKHIADVYTDRGLVIEFQHSSIHPSERMAREKFYKNMVWVIDGTRLKNDYPRFLQARNSFRRTHHPAIFHVDIMAECFPSAWIGSDVPVVFDFKGTVTIDDPRDPRHHLYCLLPKKDSRYALLTILTRRYFIDKTISGEWSSIFSSDFERPVPNQDAQQGQGRQNSNVRKESPFVLYKGRFIRRKRL